MKPEQQEIERLRRELVRMKAERDIQKEPWRVQPVDATALISSCRGGFGMARTGRPGLSAEQKHELWSRWKAGQSLSDIGRGLGKHAGSVFGVLAAHGGIMPTPRRRSVLCLGSGEREEISRGLVADFSFRRIAAQLGRPASTISREVIRNGGRRHYRATMAEGRAWHQALRPKPCVLAANPDLRSIVAAKLQD